MNWDVISGQWKQLKGEAQQRWGKLTDSDWDRIEGQREQLVGRCKSSMASSRTRPSETSTNGAAASTESREARTVELAHVVGGGLTAELWRATACAAANGRISLDR